MVHESIVYSHLLPYQPCHYVHCHECPCFSHVIVASEDKADKACFHWRRPPLQTHSGGNRPLLHFGFSVGDGTAEIHSQGQESQTCSGAVTHVLLLWMMRSKLDDNESNMRLVVVITTTFLYVDPMPLLPVGLLVKSVDDDMRPMTMSMSSDGGVHGQTVMIRLQEGKLKHSWANSHDPSAGKLAKAIIDQILEFNKVGDPDVNPDTITVKSVINAGW